MTLMIFFAHVADDSEKKKIVEKNNREIQF